MKTAIFDSFLSNTPSLKGILEYSKNNNDFNSQEPFVRKLALFDGDINGIFADDKTNLLYIASPTKEEKGEEHSEYDANRITGYHINYDFEMSGDSFYGNIESACMVPSCFIDVTKTGKYDIVNFGNESGKIEMSAGIYTNIPRNNLFNILNFDFKNNEIYFTINQFLQRDNKEYFKFDIIKAKWGINDIGTIQSGTFKIWGEEIVGGEEIEVCNQPNDYNVLCGQNSTNYIICLETQDRQIITVVIDKEDLSAVNTYKMLIPNSLLFPDNYNFDWSAKRNLATYKDRMVLPFKVNDEVKLVLMNVDNSTEVEVLDTIDNRGNNYFANKQLIGAVDYCVAGAFVVKNNKGYIHKDGADFGIYHNGLMLNIAASSAYVQNNKVYIGNASISFNYCPLCISTVHKMQRPITKALNMPLTLKMKLKNGGY